MSFKRLREQNGATLEDAVSMKAGLGKVNGLDRNLE